MDDLENNPKKSQNWIVFLLIIIIVLMLIILWPAFKGDSVGRVAKTPVDSDGDGLSDEEEKRLGTNPSNPNTDGDRYRDGQDPLPLVVNSANIVFEKINEQGNYHGDVILKNGVKIAAALIVCSSGNLGTCAKTSGLIFSNIGSILEEVIYTSSGTFVFTNIGNDHTNYLNFYIVYSLEGETLDIVPFEKGKLDSNRVVNVPYSYNLKIKKIRYVLWDLLVKQRNIDVEIKNLNYERFG